MQRRCVTHYFHLSGSLFPRYVYINYAKSKQQKFNYIEMNQSKLRSDVYKDVADRMLTAVVDKVQPQKQIILPATNPGLPINRHAGFHDSVAILSKLGRGKTDGFVTVIRSPKWKGVQEELLLGHKPQDRPDLLTRVFKLKLNVSVEEMFKDCILYAKCSFRGNRIPENRSSTCPYFVYSPLEGQDTNVRTGGLNRK